MKSFRRKSFSIILDVVLLVVLIAAAVGYFVPVESREKRLRHEPSTLLTASDIDRTKFAERVLRPLTPTLTIANGEVLQYLVSTVTANRQESLSGHFHVLHLLGRNATITSAEGSAIDGVDLLLDVELAKKFFPDGRTLAETRWGLRFPEYFAWDLSSRQRNTQAHPGQGLATLACLGVPLDAPVRLPDGKQSTVQRILDDVQANFVLDGEIYWDVVALAIYLSPAREWEDKFGRPYTFDDIVDELISRKRETMLCAGTHGLIALATLLRVDREYPILSRPHRKKLWSYLAESVALLEQSQLRDGGWSRHWMTGPAKPAATPSPENIIQATGHHLEWLILLPDDLQPNVQTLDRAARQLVRLLQTRIDNEEWLDGHYCPVIHAVRSVVLLAGYRPNQLRLNQAGVVGVAKGGDKHTSKP